MTKEEYISELLSNASKEKTNKHIENAIDILKQAYIEIAKTKISYSTEVFLRLPLYLQIANRPEEALIEFNKLLKNGYPNQLKYKELIPMDESIIYDKMRLFFQREKQYDKAISYGIYSLLLSDLGLYYQKRINELKESTEIDFLTKKVSDLLKKSSKKDSLEKILNIVKNEIDKLPNISSYNEIESLII